MKNLTSKQAIQKASSLLNNINSSVSAINKHHQLIEAKSTDLRALLTGLTNMGPAQEEKPAKEKPAKVVSTLAKVAKVAKEKPAKATKEKVAKPVKPAKEKAEKSAKEAKAKPVKNGAAKSTDAETDKTAPTVKSVIVEIIKSLGPQTKPTLYKLTEKYGKWSRQSFYNALKDPMFGENEGNVTLVVFPKEKTTEVKTSDEDVDKFVSMVEDDGLISAVI